MTVTTVAIERQKKDNPPPPKDNCFACGGQTAALSLYFLTDSSLVLCSASELVTYGNMRRYKRSSRRFHSFVNMSPSIINEMYIESTILRDVFFFFNESAITPMNCAVLAVSLA